MDPTNWVFNCSVLPNTKEIQVKTEVTLEHWVKLNIDGVSRWNHRPVGVRDFQTYIGSWIKGFVANFIMCMFRLNYLPAKESFAYSIIASSHGLTTGGEKDKWFIKTKRNTTLWNIVNSNAISTLKVVDFAFFTKSLTSVRPLFRLIFAPIWSLFLVRLTLNLVDLGSNYLPSIHFCA